MSAAQHTPGLWKVSVFKDHDGPPTCDQIEVQCVIENTWHRLCECDWSETSKYSPFCRADAMANASLIAAAPDLLAALTLMVKQFTKARSTLQDSMARVAAHAAIAKATGETS